MNFSDKSLVLILILGSGAILGIGLGFNIIVEISFFFTVIPFLIVLYKYIQRNSEIRDLRKQKLESEIGVAIEDLVNLLEKQNESIEVKEGFRKKSIGFFKKDNFSETIILSCFEIVKILKIDNLYKRGYALALAYAVSYARSLQDGAVATEIDNSVRTRGTSPYGKNPKLEENEITWYKRFWESNDLLTNTYEEVFTSVKELDLVEIDQKQSLVKLNIEDLHKVFKLKESKVDKLIKLIAKDIDPIDFNKILSTLRTDVVIISTTGTSGSHTKSGYTYLKKILDDELSASDPKLNRSVRFVLFDQLTKNETDPIFFDLKNWGEKIDRKTRELQEEKGGEGSTFSFVVVKSSIHELYFFGDDLPEKGAIRLPPEIFDGLKPEETTKSTLQVLAKALSKEKLSLRDFIERNLEYLDGIPDNETAKRITLNLEKHCNVSKWTISDFARPDLKIEYFTEIGISDEQANLIISEAKELSSILKSP